MKYELKISDDVKAAFPSLEARLILVDGLKARPLDEELEKFKLDAYSRIRAAHSPDSIKDDRVFRAYRDFYWRLGIDPTKVRPASEALVRRIAQGKELPSINTLVDSYNLASALSGVPLAAFDADKVVGAILTMRFSKPGEEFLGIGMAEPRELSGRELVVEDGAGLIAIYPHRDSDRTKVVESTSKALIMVCGAPGVGHDRLESAERLAVELLRRYSSFTK